MSYKREEKFNRAYASFNPSEGGQVTEILPAVMSTNYVQIINGVIKKRNQYIK